MRRIDSLEKTLILGGTGSRKRRGQQRMRWLDDITDSMDVSLSELRSWWWTGKPGVLQFMGSQRVGHDWVTELNWTEPNMFQFRYNCCLLLIFSVSLLKFCVHSFFFQHQWAFFLITKLFWNFYQVSCLCLFHEDLSLSPQFAWVCLYVLG